MSLKLTILAFVLAVISVTAAVVIVPAGAAKSNVQTKRKLIAPGMLAVEQVRAIELRRDENTTLRFEQVDNSWMQTQPIAYPMDAFSMRQLVIQALETEVVDEVTSGDGEQVSASMLGLDPPIATLTYETDSGATTIKLGRRGLGGRAYAQIQGDDAVLVIRGELHDRAVVMEPKEWRSRTLFSNISIDAQRITYKAGNTTVELKKDRRQWVMSQPVATRADPLKVEDYVANLAKAQLNGFILDAPEALDRFGLEPGVGVVEVDAGQGTSVQRVRLGLPIGSSSGDRFALVEGRAAVVRVNAATVQALFPAPEMLIDPTGSGVQPADVKAVTIRAGEQELVFERDLEKWRCKSRDNIEVNPALVEDLLKTLCELRAPQISLEPFPMDQQTAMVTFTGFGDRPLDTVRIIRDEANGQWKLENGDNVLRILPASVRLRLNAEDYGFVAPIP